MKRPIAVLLAVLLAAAVLLDPYTFHLNASDAVLPAPWWQQVLGIADAVLLAAAGILLWRHRPAAAFRLTGTEIFYALGVGILFVGRDGVARFSRGFAGEEYLTLYLGTVASRVVLLLLAQALAARARRQPLTKCGSGRAREL